MLTRQGRFPQTRSKSFIRPNVNLIPVAAALPAACLNRQAAPLDLVINRKQATVPTGGTEPLEERATRTTCQ